MKAKRGTYTPSRYETYKHGTHRARCNKRSCQARRNLSKHPALYVRWPKCHIPGCDGVMYVDWYRMKGGPKDNAPVCRDSTCQHHRNTGNLVPFHRVSSIGCSGYDGYVTKRNLAPRSKHSPIPEQEWIPF